MICYPNVEVNREAMLEVLHGLQVDLSLLVEALARDPEPVLRAGAISTLTQLRTDLSYYAPSVRRH